MAVCLVTGGAGFIGSHMSDLLLERGHEVVVFDNLSQGSRENVPVKAHFVQGDVRSDVAMRALFEQHRFDFVFHLAAQMNVRASLANPVEDAEINILGSLRLLECCRAFKVKKIVFSSTGGAIYAPDAPLPCTEGSETRPQSPYGLAKMAIEQYLRLYREVFTVVSVVMRFANVYGPRQNSKGEAGVVSIFLRNLYEGKPLVIFGDGKQTRDFVYVRDVANATLAALELEGTFNVGTGEGTAILELAHELQRLTGKQTAIVHERAIVGELLHNRLSAAHLLATGWKREYSIEQGLRETAEWFAKKYG